MVYRYSWIAGITAIALAFWELSSLLRDSDSGTPWPVAILVSVLLGAGLTWTAIAYRSHAVVIVGVNILGFIMVAGLLVAPETLFLVFPTPETLDAFRFELSRAWEIIRFGVEPVRPVPGLIMLIATLFWTLGFLLVAGLLNSRPFVAVLTPLIVALQFAIIDRRAKSLWHIAVFIGIVALSLLAVRLDERDSGTGRLQRVTASGPPSRRPSTAIVVLIAVTLILSVSAVAVAGDAIPNNGLVPWRSPAGYSDEYSGGAAYNPYTDIRASLINQTNLPLFQAEIQGVDPARVRFRTVTLDTYEGGRWKTNRVKIYPLDEDPWIAPQHEYRGETERVEVDIVIDQLSQPWLPAPSTPVEVATSDDSDLRAMRIRRIDGALMLPGDFTYQGMRYAVRADMPRYDGPTVAALALAEDGTLSPLFEEADKAGEDLPDFTGLPAPLTLEDEDYWLQLPEDEITPQFVAIAEEQVGRVETNFEKALMLENWFRDSNEFTYEDSVPGAYVTGDLVEWLTDADGRLTDPETGISYAKTGYCEQFATTMALMARAVGVPSRVVLGFTPGRALNDTIVQVEDRNAHSWVELWIPSYGWMAFDPTPRSGHAAQTANEALTDALEFSPAAYADQIPEGSFVDTEGGDIFADDGRFDTSDRPEFAQPVLGGGSSEDSGGIDLPVWARYLSGLVIVILLVTALSPLVTWFRRRRRDRRLSKGDISAAWEDIVDRLADLKEPIDPADTPLEAASSIDDAFVPLARVYGRALYGDGSEETALLDRASDAHLQATQHLTTRYSTGERLRAVYRPSRLITRWKAISQRLAPKR